LAWLDLPPASHWLDVGCGTGALSQTILIQTMPAAVKGIDRSPAYIDYAKSHIQDSRASFEVGDAQNLPVESAAFDTVVSALVLNFIPDIPLALSEMSRVIKPGGVVAIYVWDYAHKMELMRYFWNAAILLNPAALELDEGRRFPICSPEPLLNLFEAAGLHELEVRPIDVLTHFRDFDDYWSPFLQGQGPAPSYAMSLDETHRLALREQIRATLPVASDGRISLIARAWAVRGRSD